MYIIDVCSWGPIDHYTALVQIVAWRRTGNKPLYDPMITHFTDAYMRRHWASMSFKQAVWSRSADTSIFYFFYETTEA